MGSRGEGQSAIGIRQSDASGQSAGGNRQLLSGIAISGDPDRRHTGQDKQILTKTRWAHKAVAVGLNQLFLCAAACAILLSITGSAIAQQGAQSPQTSQPGQNQTAVVAVAQPAAAHSSALASLALSNRTPERIAVSTPAHPLTLPPARPIIIKAGRILTVTQGTIENGVLVIRDGKIAAIGKQGEVALPADAEVIDASGMWVMPGQIDLHTHIGNNSGLHDYVHSLNPAFHVWEYIDPDDSKVKDSIASGITTLLTIPGSGGNNSGFGVLWKLAGAKREDLIIRKLGAIKIAQAYNPERKAGDLGLGRMGMWWMIREQFDRAKKYTAKMDAADNTPHTPGSESGVRHTSLTKSTGAPGRGKAAGGVSMASLGAEGATKTERAAKSATTSKRRPAPEKILGLEQMRTVMEHKTPVFVHTAGARDVMGTMRLFHDELNLPVVISHGEFGGLKAAEEAAKRNIPCNIGPRFYDFSFQTYDRRFYSIPQAYVDAGVQNISLNTDCPVIPGDDLFVQGTISVRMGMDEDLALRALTINPARTIGIGDRVGSLEVGKDADIVIKRGSLFDPRNPIEKVLINGKVVYTHGQRRHGADAGPSAPLPPTEDDGCARDPEIESFLSSHAR